DGVLRGLLRRRGAEGGDGRGPEHAEAALLRRLQHVPEALDVDLPGEAGLLLPRGREEAGEVVHGADVVGVEEGAEAVAVAYVAPGVGAAVGVRLRLEVGGEDGVGAVAVAEGADEVAADLALRAGDEDRGALGRG